MNWSGIAWPFLIVVSISASAVADEPGTSEIEKLAIKINGSVDRGKWSLPSREFVKSLWAEYKQAHLKNEQKLNYHGTGKVMPKIRAYKEYVGRYEMQGERRGAFLEVFADKQGRYFVKLEGHVIPAVAWNKMILFTTSDVVYSKVPDLGAKPHATLEFFVVAQVPEGFVFSAPGEALDAGRKLVKAASTDEDK